MGPMLELLQSQPIANAILILSIVIVLGLGLGAIRIRGIHLGSAGVLFAGIILAHFGARIDHDVLDFVKEFGLVLFVFMIGMQLGPGFFGSLRKNGLRLNLIAVAVVLLGTAAAPLLALARGLPRPGVIGVLTGATTNTPSLGAAQQIAASLPELAAEDAATRMAMGYAVAYPMGILGIITALALIRIIFRIDAPAEAHAIDRERDQTHEPIERRTLIVRNANFAGLAIRDLPHMADFGVQISRHRPADAEQVRVASGDTVLNLGDHLVAVGARDELDHFQRMIGERARIDLAAHATEATARRIIVTRKSVVGQTLAELHLGKRFGVRVTRLIRSGVEMAAFGSIRLQFGDALMLVGEEGALARASEALGNAPRALDETQFLPIFLGIALGVLVGLIPIAVPGLPEPVRLGLAGGPLILAIALSRLGQIGPVLWYIPGSARLAFRELGITLFLACVGLKAGEQFFQTVLSERGLLWLGLAGIIAVGPPLVVGCVVRRTMRMNYATLSGVLAGSMTDPPALAFASGSCRSEAPFLGYATVYPLTMVLRIVLIQILVLINW